MPPAPLGPSLPPTEHLPSEETAVLSGHEGPVLAVRFNRTGTYCLTCGKVGMLLQPTALVVCKQLIPFAARRTEP